MSNYDPNFGKQPLASSPSAVEKPSNAQPATDQSPVTVTMHEAESLIKIYTLLDEYRYVVSEEAKKYGTSVSFNTAEGWIVPHAVHYLPTSNSNWVNLSVFCENAERVYALKILDIDPFFPSSWMCKKGGHRVGLMQAEQPSPPIETLADKAKALVYGDRNKQYGSPAEDYERVSKVWSGLLCNKLKPGECITKEEALMMMAALKLCREFHKHKDDNIIDAHGYLLCLDWVQKDEQKSEKDVDEVKK